MPVEPFAILFALLPIVIVVWLVSSVLGHLRRNAEANERIAEPLEEANALRRVRSSR
jgi:hypothetical protein